MRTKTFIGAVAAAMVLTSLATAQPKTATDADLTACTTERHRARTLAAKGDPNGFLYLGRLYFFGFCVPFDREKARQNLERAEALGLACAPVLLETERKSSFGDRGLDRQVLFQRCAYSLTVSEDLRLAKGVVAEMVSPAKVPVELTEEIERIFGIIKNAPEKTLPLARRYISSENAPVLRKASRYWLRKLAVKPSPAQTESQYLLGKLVFEPDDSTVKERGNHIWLMMAASAGHVLAQRDLGLYYLQRSGSTKDKVRGYAWLLVAKRSGLDVRQLLEEAGRHFDADNTTDAQELSKTLPIGRRP